MLSTCLARWSRDGLVVASLIALGGVSCRSEDGAAVDPRGVDPSDLQALSQTGGSVLTYFAVGKFATDPSPATWDSDVKGMIAWYHLDPASVRARLAALRAHGQQKVGVVLWFVEPDNSTDIAHAHYMIPRADYTLYPQHQQNLVNFLKDADAAGFEEVQIRFGQQGGATPQCFQNPACYSDPNLFENPHLQGAIDFNWAIIKHVVSVSEGAGVRVRRLYDICPEYPGIRFMAEHPLWYEFTHDLWARYIAELKPQGITATMSFNHADYAGTEASFDLFDELGYPDILSLDIYEGMYGNLGNFADALERHGKVGAPLFIQETYFNDPFTANELVRAVRDFKLNLQFVMQWPWLRGTDSILPETAQYDNYLNLAQRPIPSAQPSVGTITASPATCVLPAGADRCTSTLTWSTTGVTDVKVMAGASTVSAGPSGSTTVSWIPLTYVRFDLFGDGNYLGSATIHGVPNGTSVPPPENPPPTTPQPTTASGTISAAPKTCTIPTGSATCASTISWSTTGVTEARVKIGGATFAAALSGSQVAPWIGDAPAVFELYGDGSLLGSVTVQGVIEVPPVEPPPVDPPPMTLPPPTSSLRGSVSAAPQLCVIAPGASLCSTTISWSTTGVTDARVKIGSQLFAMSPSGSQIAPWVSETGGTFELWGDGELLASVVVKGVKIPGSNGLLQASLLVCKIPTGSSTCTSTLFWSLPGATDVRVKIDGNLFASGPSGSQAAPWINEAPAVFELWADGAKVDSLTVRGMR